MAQQSDPPAAEVEPDQRVRLHRDEISVSRRRVVRETVRVRTWTTEHEQRIDETLTDERVEVLRVSVGRVVDAVPEVRQEGDVTILPVVVEEIVVQRRLVLKEEVHLRRTRVPRAHQETIILRHQDAIVTRTGADDHEADVGDGPGTNTSAQDT